MKKLTISFFAIICLCSCLCLLCQQIAYAKDRVAKVHITPKKSLSFLFVDKNSNKSFDDGEPLVVMAADDYIELFQKDVPLERMLRSQIQNTEFIVLTQDDFIMMDTNHDRMITAVDYPPYRDYDLYMTLAKPQNKQLTSIARPSIFLYKAQEKKTWHYLITFKYRASSSPIIRQGTIADKTILQALHINDFNALLHNTNLYQPNILQKKIIIQTLLSLPNNVPLYKIYFAHASGSIEHDLITTDAQMVNLGELKSIVLSAKSKSPTTKIDEDAAYFSSGTMIKIHSSEHYLNWMGL